MKKVKGVSCGGPQGSLGSSGCLRRSWKRKQLATITQLGLGLVLRRSQEQQEVGKRRKSKKNSCGGLATQDLDLPRLHLASLAAGLVPGQHSWCAKREMHGAHIPHHGECR